MAYTYIMKTMSEWVALLLERSGLGEKSLWALQDYVMKKAERVSDREWLFRVEIDGRMYEAEYTYKGLADGQYLFRDCGWFGHNREDLMVRDWCANKAKSAQPIKLYAVESYEMSVTKHRRIAPSFRKHAPKAVRLALVLYNVENTKCHFFETSQHIDELAACHRQSNYVGRLSKWLSDNLWGSEGPERFAELGLVEIDATKALDLEKYDVLIRLVAP